MLTWMPKHTSFMDQDMFNLFQEMNPTDLVGYRLFGGTALALYINHRRSIDFDFFSDSVVRKSDLQLFEWLDGAEFQGEEGMVDVTVIGNSRNIRLNFVDLKLFSNVEPKYPPVHTRNGIPVAHVVDLLASKLSALSNRKELKDFQDVATAIDILQEPLKEAISIYTSSSLTREASCLDLARTLQNYSLEVEYGLTKSQLVALEEFIDKLLGNRRRNDSH